MGLQNFRMSKIALEKHAYTNADAIVSSLSFKHYELVIAYVI